MTRLLVRLPVFLSYDYKVTDRPVSAILAACLNALAYRLLCIP